MYITVTTVYEGREVGGGGEVGVGGGGGSAKTIITNLKPLKCKVKL